MVINVKQAIIVIGAISVSLILFVNLGEVVALVKGTLHSQTQNVTPVYVKVLKDILFLISISISLIWLVLSCRVISPIKVLLSAWLFFVFAALIASYELPWICLLLGLRWVMPIILLVLLIDLVDREAMVTISNFLKYVFFVHFTFQLVQLVFGGTWYGSFLGGYSLRNPGLFLIPSSGALFSCLCFLFLNYFAKVRFSVLAPITILSVLMTVSLTGIALGFLFVSYVYFRRFFSSRVIMLFACIACAGLILSVDQFAHLLGRGDDVIAVSGGARADIFLDTWGRVGLVSRFFGLATNSAVLYFNGNYNAFIADSMYVSVLANLGLLGFLFYVFLLSFFFVWSIFISHDFSILLSLFIVLSSLTSVITELYPINFIVPFAVAFVLRPGLGLNVR
ncbi:hypothetical protein [Marinagarivorans cellulosilyticus]|uniref:Uncharacterized protein n=1 Tax=Marinagarivorans cellulosilyticus TaxID=2721545 RepID=A0AAN1WIQ7_9GAMM|nr:hypothetical protein [Marinagarivorans cellulosilyticus]BCD98334.1 hypothetical protein MARGE09_P2535 [Marinagarivorans cellulosilyticus]